jgi:hypothetical protein
MRKSRRLVAALFLLALFSINCGLVRPVLDRIRQNETLARLTQGSDDSEATRRRPTPRPTFTPTPNYTATPTASPTPTNTPIPTATPIPTETPIPPPTPTVFVVSVTVQQEMNVRQGPGTNYPVVGSAPAGASAPVVGRNADSSWVQVEYPPGSGTFAWLYTQLLSVNGDLAPIAVAQAAAPPPAPPPTAPPPPPQEPPTPAPPPTPSYAFRIVEEGNRQFQKTTATFISGIVLITDANGTPLGGYRVVGTNSAGERYESAQSTWRHDALNGLEGYIKQGNLKFEPPGGYNDTTWTIYVVDSNGSQVSAPKALTYPSDPNQRAWDFIHWSQ